VLVWQSQLAANDFPPVCAMSGAPAETWRRFSFSTSPGWSFWVGGLMAAALTAQRASGYLPLTRASRQKLRALTWGTVALLPLAVLMFVIALVLPGSTATFALFMLGLAVFFVGLIAALIVRQTYGPTGKVFEPQPGQNQSLVGLNNVHPEFVRAVQQLQHSRSQAALQPQAPLAENWK
jgi:hypothetical protein